MQHIFLTFFYFTLCSRCSRVHLPPATFSAACYSRWQVGCPKANNLQSTKRRTDDLDSAFLPRMHGIVCCFVQGMDALRRAAYNAVHSGKITRGPSHQACGLSFAGCLLSYNQPAHDCSRSHRFLATFSVVDRASRIFLFILSFPISAFTLFYPVYCSCFAMESLGACRLILKCDRLCLPGYKASYHHVPDVFRILCMLFEVGLHLGSESLVFFLPQH